MASKAWLKLGIVGRAHGLRGSFFVSGRDEAVPSSVKTVRVGIEPEAAKVLHVQHRAWQNGKAYLTCEGVVQREQVDAFKGLPVWCAKADIKVDEATEFVLSDLVDRTVIDSDGTIVGVVEDVYPTLAGHANIVVLNPAETADVEIPATNHYLDMDFERGADVLNLRVPVETFADVWNERGRKQ